MPNHPSNGTRRRRASHVLGALAAALVALSACGSAGETDTTIEVASPIVVHETTTTQLPATTTSTTYDLRRLVPVVGALDRFAHPAAVPGRIPRVYRPSTHRAQAGTPVPTTRPPAPPGAHPSYMPGPGQDAVAASPCHEGGGRALSNPPIPRWVVLRESGGNYCIRNEEGSTACGAYQITRGTWHGYAGYPDACSAPPWAQDARATEVWAGGRGCGNWGRAACG